MNQNSDKIFFNIGGLLDFVSFLNHASIFYTSYLTNVSFKRYVDQFFNRKKTQSNSQNNLTNNST